jgi:hypothetical protein
MVCDEIKYLYTGTEENPSYEWVYLPSLYTRHNTLCTMLTFSLDEYDCVKITWSEEAWATVEDPAMIPDLVIGASTKVFNDTIPYEDGAYLEFTWHQVLPSRYDGQGANGSSVSTINLPGQKQFETTSIPNIDRHYPLIIDFTTDMADLWWGITYAS